MSEAFNVYLNSKLIGTVFVNEGLYNAEEMKRSLVNHDEYDADIVVKKKGKIGA